jgi:hypothetical protein
MWICKKCGETLEDNFDSCWKCSTPKNENPAAPSDVEAKPAWRMAYKMFRGTLASWDDLFSEAAAFATSIGPERVVGISHSEDRDAGVVTVWYWTDENNQGPI